MRKVILIVTAVAILQVLYGQEKEAKILESVRVTLTVEKKELSVYDPLLIKISIANAGEKDLKYARPLSDPWGSLIFELQKPNDSEFRRLYTLWSGMKDGSAPLKLQSGETLEENYQLLFIGRFLEEEPDFIFNVPGIYKLRIKIAERIFVEGNPLPSEITELNVKPRDDKSKENIEKNKESLGFVIPIAYYQGKEFHKPDDKSFREVKENLHASGFENALQFAEGRTLYESSSEEDKKVGIMKLKDLANSDKPLWNEYAEKFLEERKIDIKKY